MYTIEKNKGLEGSNPPFTRMEVGDSFVMFKHYNRQNLQKAASMCYYWSKKLNMKFTARKCRINNYDKVRVFRLF